jgi:hypothetical protein
MPWPETTWMLPFRSIVYMVACLAVFPVGVSLAGDPIQHFNPANPRPDLFRKPIYQAWVPYRAAYNRPTYLGGKMASIIEPTSQEAYGWEVAKARGDYQKSSLHQPCKTPVAGYFYPKPWEALPIEARPNAPLSTPMISE